MTDLRIPKIEIKSAGTLLDYKDFRQYSDFFLESGTAAGDGIQRALDAGFKHVTSIEASEKWYKQSLERKYKYSDDTLAIIVSLGKSTDVIKDYDHIKTGLCVIFLDAHPAGPQSAGHNELMAGDNEWSQDAIIKSELAIILATDQQHCIIIDDVNGLTDGFAVEYMAMILAKWPDYTFTFYDENLSGDPEYYYKDKVLVCEPKKIDA